MGPTNNDRARSANTALSAFINEVAHDGHGETDETMIADLLCNIRHLADAQGWEIEKLWERAQSMHAEEVRHGGGKADASFAGDDSEAVS